MRKKDDILLEQAYSKVLKENLNNGSKRIPFNETLNGEVKLNSYFFTVPAENFPQDVLSKISELYGFSMEELISDGVPFDDVSFGADLDINEGESYAEYNGPSIRQSSGENSLGGVSLTSWKMTDQKDDYVFTTKNQDEQQKMNLTIQEYLQKNIDENTSKYEEKLSN